MIEAGGTSRLPAPGPQIQTFFLQAPLSCSYFYIIWKMTPLNLNPKPVHAKTPRDTQHGINCSLYGQHSRGPLFPVHALLLALAFWGVPFKACYTGSTRVISHYRIYIPYLTQSAMAKVPPSYQDFI